MVKLCVVFSGLSQDLAQLAWPAPSAAASSVAALSAAAPSGTLPCAAAQGGVGQNWGWESELSLDYEHALMLLLNAADVQMEVQGLFLIDKNSSFLDDESLIKKFKQLDLFEVPCSACTVNDQSSDNLAVLLHKLPFINAITYQDFNHIVSQSEHVIWL